MSFSIIIAGFGKEPEDILDRTLDYRGFNHDLVGKETIGQTELYDLESSVDNSYIKVVRVLDENIHSNNIILVFRHNLNSDVVKNHEAVSEFQQRFKDIFSDIVKRFNLTVNIEILGPWSSDEAIGMLLLDAANLIEEELIVIRRNNLKLIQTFK